MQTLDILGKKYRLQTGLNSGEAEKINAEIAGRLRMLASEYPDLDKIDMLVLYIVELSEKINSMEKEYKKGAEKLDKARGKIASLERKVAQELKKS